MPSWGDLLKEIQAEIAAKSPAPFDAVRRKYLLDLHNHTGRNVVLYATKWVQPSSVPPEMVMIVDEDVSGFMEALYGLKGDKLDLIVHSPGGSLESAEAIVTYLRSKFSYIRVFVPYAAMSAATMLCCAANEIIMGKHSFLGPTDPQLILPSPNGTRSVAMQAILEEFRNIQNECAADPKKISSWLPILNQYYPGLLQQCDNATKLGRQLVADWVEKYMFGGTDRPKAEAIADFLCKHNIHKSHARHIGIAELKNLGLKVFPLEADQTLQEKVLTVYHATMHTFMATAATKIIENHEGRAFLKMMQVHPILVGAPAPGPKP